MKTPIESPLTLEEVAEHFEQWRRGKKKGERIPQPLTLTETDPPLLTKTDPLTSRGIVFC